MKGTEPGGTILETAEFNKLPWRTHMRDEADQTGTINNFYARTKMIYSKNEGLKCIITNRAE